MLLWQNIISLFMNRYCSWDDFRRIGKTRIADTIVIYTTDNGYSTGAHGFGGKSFFMKKLQEVLC